MKILFLTDGLFPFQLGGMQKHSSLLIQLFAEQGIQVTVIHPGGKTYSEKELRNQISDSEQINFRLVKFPQFKKIPGHYVRENKAYSKACFELVKNELKDFDLIYAQGFSADYFLRAKKFGWIVPPVFLNLHGLEMFQPITGWKNKLANIPLRKIALFQLHHADYIYSFGGKLSYLLESLKIPSSKILLQSNGISNDWLVEEVRNNHEVNFLFIGRNERRKGFEELVEAIQQLNRERHLVFRMHFIGPVSDEKLLQEKNVFFHGEIRNSSAIKEIVRGCDCLVVPSYSEGMPTVILEAMASGLAVIATDVGAVSRMIAGNGILIKKADPNEVAIAMRKILSLSSTELVKLKLKSIELVKQKYIWRQVAGDKIKDFQRLVKQN